MELTFWTYSGWMSNKEVTDGLEDLQRSLPLYLCLSIFFYLTFVNRSLFPNFDPSDMKQKLIVFEN